METASLLVSEVVSNAVRHGDPVAPISLTCRVEGESLHAVVRNRGSRPDPPLPSRRGSGLQLVAALSKRWGSRRREDGIEVWFEV
jgi:two-component sensor histidine kinase